jgi:metal-responsive CopG/Arc/MetJ family transcriptional regulator
MEKEKIKRPKIERERIMISINRRILEEMDKIRFDVHEFCEEPSSRSGFIQSAVIDKIIKMRELNKKNYGEENDTN